MARKRRSEQVSDPESGEEYSTPQRGRGRRNDSDEDVTMEDPDTQLDTQANSNVEMMVKKLVRLALACEYSRIPIRRGDISAKVLGTTGSRLFKPVFAGAQQTLRVTFGMQMEELPTREKTSLSQRRVAQLSQKVQSASSKSWILISVLPDEYKTDPTILPPTKAPSEHAEATYTAFYTFIISLIMLNNGALSEAKLERYLKRANADTSTPTTSTEKMMQRLVKDGYVDKRRDTTGGEEIIEWVVGPRGKVEVGGSGVQGLVRAVYGADQERDEELERKLHRSLNLKPPATAGETDAGSP